MPAILYLSPSIRLGSRGGCFLSKAKEYRDPLYGFIELDKTEQAIVETPYFQRLRRINQLGMTFLVYPSANHTRFEHSLGTVYAISAMLTALADPLKEKLEWTDDKFKYYQALARLAALTHDLGHPPFSHAAEQEVFPKVNGTRFTHEDYSYQIITKTEIASSIKDAYGGDADKKVAEIATGHVTSSDEVFLSELLTGDFGADRIDYLMRDSYHLGVQYGKFDLHRLLNTLRIRRNEETQDLELAVEIGGLHTVEAFLLARYFMFLEVYYHKTRRILDRHLAEFLVEHLPGGCFSPNLEDYLCWDDTMAMEALKANENKMHMQRILARKHFRLAWESEDHPEPQELERFDWLQTHLKSRYDVGKLRFDEATKSPYSFERPPIFVSHRGGYSPLTEKSPLVRQLRKIEKCRVYAAPELREEVAAAANEFWKNREARRGRS